MKENLFRVRFRLGGPIHDVVGTLFSNHPLNDKHELSLGQLVIALSGITAAAMPPPQQPWIVAGGEDLHAGAVAGRFARDAIKPLALAQPSAKLRLDVLGQRFVGGAGERGGCENRQANDELDY